MALDDELKGISKLSSSVFALDTKQGFSIGCEVEDVRGIKRLKYTPLVNFNGEGIISIGDNARIASTDEYASLSGKAYGILSSYNKKMPRLLEGIRDQSVQVYIEIVSPLKIEPVRKRDWSNSLTVLGVTLTYPVAVPSMFVYHVIAGSSVVDGVSVLVPLATMPAYFPWAVKEIVSPSVKGVKIANPEIIKPRPLSKNYVALGTWGGLEPEFFGDESSAKVPGAYLRVILPGGLEMNLSGISWPQDRKRNAYTKASHFIETSHLLIEKVKDLDKESSSVVGMWHEFYKRKMGAEVESIAKSAGLII